MLIDRYNRVHNYLRISLTDNCNLRCFYCMPEDDYVFTPASQLMQPDEIYEIAKCFVSLGVDKIRLTGGEPLVRKDAADIILSLSRLPVKLALTTNATRLHEFADVLKTAGLQSINISLDTLQEERFTLITRRPHFRRVYDNIRLMIDRGLHVKVNMVVVKGLNDDEILDFVDWTEKQPVHVRFIEFMPFTGNRWSNNKVFTYQEMLDIIQTKYQIEHLPGKASDTAKAYRVAGHLGTFAVISTMSQPFCGGCNRLRLTADGKMKNCLFSENETDLLTVFRKGEDIVPLIRNNVLTKAKELGGQFSPDTSHLQPETIHNRSMITIGG